MRKKILSVLLALCMVLTLLPVAAFAAKLTDAQVAELKAKGYTDEQIDAINAQIADYESDEVVLVFEDTTITEAESRLVVVVAPQATVTVDGAKLDTGIVVAPGATDAKIALKAGADVNAVVVLDKAEVVVEKDAKATNVTLAAAEAAATVEGAVDTVAVNELAEKATVTVAETAKVDTVNIDAAGVTAEIKADTQVVLGDNAADVEVKAAEEVKVDVSGNSDALTESSNVGDKANEEKKDETTEEPAPVDPGGSGNQPSTPTEVIVLTSNNVSGKGSGTIAVAIPQEEGKTFAYCVITKDGKTGKVTISTVSTTTKTGTELNAINTNANAEADKSYDVITYTVSEGHNVDASFSKVENLTDIQAAVTALNNAIDVQAAAQEAYDAVKDAGTAAETTLAKADVIAADALKKLLDTDTSSMSDEEKTTHLGKINAELKKIDTEAAELDSLDAAKSLNNEKYTAALNEFNTATAAKETAEEKSDNLTTAQGKTTSATTDYNNAVKDATEITVKIDYEEPAPETPPATEEPTTPTTPGGPAAGGGETEGDGDKTEDTGSKDQTKDPVPAANNGLE